MPLKAKMYIALIAASGLAALCFAVYPWESQNLMRFGFYLALALIGSGSKVRLPGITGTLSVYFLFVLLSIVELKLPETMVIVAAATLLQCYCQAKNRPSAAQVVFNTTSVFMAYAVPAVRTNVCFGPIYPSTYSSPVILCSYIVVMAL